MIVWKNQLRDAQSMCTVGTVYVNSPANKAGLLSGDSVVVMQRTCRGDRPLRNEGGAVLISFPILRVGVRGNSVYRIQKRQ